MVARIESETRVTGLTLRASFIRNNNGCPSTLCYTYNAEGQRVRKIAGGTTTEYIYGMSGVVAEKVGTTWTVGYVYANGQLVAQYKDSTTYAVHKDHLGSTRLLTKVNKTKLEDGYDYYPYGEPIGSSGSGTKRKFTDHERDSETGLDYMGARYYTSLTGRFMSPDLPFLDQNSLNPQRWNLYSYGRNNPIAFSDPTGHAPESAFCTLAKCAPYERNGGDPSAGTWEDEDDGDRTPHVSTEISIFENDGVTVLRHVVTAYQQVSNSEVRHAQIVTYVHFSNKNAEMIRATQTTREASTRPGEYGSFPWFGDQRGMSESEARSYVGAATFDQARAATASRGLKGFVQAVMKDVKDNPRKYAMLAAEAALPALRVPKAYVHLKHTIEVVGMGKTAYSIGKEVSEIKKPK